MKKFVSIILSLSLLSNLAIAKDGVDLFSLNAGKTAGAISINQAVDMALANNTTILVAEKNSEIYDQQVRQYWSYVYPRIALTGSYTRALKQAEAIIPALGGKVKMGAKNSASAAAEATLLLWKGGAVSAGIKMGDYFSQSGHMQLKDAQSRIKDLVTVLCFGIILSHALIQVQQENLNIAKNHLKEIELKYKQGLASDLDILSQKVKISNSLPPVIQAKNAYEIGLLTLRRVLNKDPQEPLDLFWQLEDIFRIKISNLEDLYEMAALSRPDLVVARLNTKIAEQQIKIARADNYGEIVAFANGTYTGASDSVLIPTAENNSSLGANAGLRLSIPLFEGFRVASIIRQRQLAYEQALLLQKDAERNVKIEVKEAWLNFNEAKERINATRGTIDQAHTNLDRMTLRFRNGLASRLDLDDAALLLYNAELQFVLAMHDAFTALSNLNYAVGKEVIIQ